MTDVRRALALFDRAVALDAEARATLLDEECANDADLRIEVEQLIAADAEAGDFLAKPLIAVEDAHGDRSGEILGAYRLVAAIGSGGMGSVYRAVRADAAFDKPVAIKLLVFDAGDLRSRFAQEQRILGNLNHANIATLLDVGRDANGAPYFVMEYIDGVPITRYVRDRALSVAQRIELFLPILDAVQSAHSQLIVHRDIKPGNVLVDTHGTPKLLDFGIAKLLEDGAAAKTRTGISPLTPEYASPEQVRGQPVGTPSDLYSLGVLLYELVTGKRPYEIVDTSPIGIERVVGDAEPARPSAFIDTGRIDGNARDLDAILLKAMAKSPAQRYASCTEFAADLRRWLGAEAVVAREPPTRERLERYVRRHLLGVAVGAAASIALAVGSALALWQAHVARGQARLASDQARIAVLERDRATRVSKFLTDALGAANPSDLGRKASVIDVLARARNLADKELSGDPASAAITQIVLSETYRALADFSAARDSAARAVAAAERAGEATLQIDADFAMASAVYALGDLRAALTSVERARARAVASGSPKQRADTATLLGQIASENGDTDRAFAWYEQALRELPADDIRDRATVLNNYGAAKHQKGDEAGALAKYQQAIALVVDSGDEATAALYGNLAAALRVNGRLDEAIEVMTTKVLPKQIELLGENSPDVIWTLTNLVTCEYERNDKVAMLAYARRAYDAAEHLPDENEWKNVAIKKYGLSLLRSDRAAEAVPVLGRAVALSRGALPEGHYSIGSAESALGLARAMAGDRAAGEALARGAYERLLAKYGEKFETTVSAKKNLEKIEALSKR